MSDMPEKIAVRKLDQYGSFYAYLHDTAFLEAGKSTPYIRADIADQLVVALGIFLSDYENNQKNGPSTVIQTRGKVEKARATLAAYRKAKGE